MRNYDEFKKTIMFFMSFSIFILMTFAFAYIWYDDYGIEPEINFFRRGNWLMITLYALMLTFFSRMFGAYKVGYYKMSDVVYSQFLSVLFVNFLVYIEISLVARRFAHVFPIVLLTVIDAVIIVAWTYLATKIYASLFPPKRLLIIYSSHNAVNLITKMCQRSDKYQICEAINIEEGLEKIKERINVYDGAII
ncbi:MAG: sugar transferase, partial [Oscillospiraceae bacterium]|nr:sugar transferase [Oscillospiraceae bacterium]